MTATSEIACGGVPDRAAKRGVWLAVFAFLAAIYLVVNFLLPHIPSPELNYYVAQPVLWAALTAIALYGWKHWPDERPVFRTGVALMALLAAAFQIAISFLAGVFYGFGRSPYSHQALGLMGNLLYLGTMLAGIEMCRAYLVTVLGKRSPMLAVGLLAIVFSIISIPVGKYPFLSAPEGAFRILGGTILPTLSENMLACFLALLGGPLPAILYRGALIAFEWLSPILPRLHWTITAFIETLAPVFGMMVIRGLYMSDSVAEEETKHRTSKGVTALWLVVAMLAVGLLWFNTGLFGFGPFVVVGDSMEPALLAGDMVITRTVPAESIKVGDIIRFQRNNAYVLHRVIDIQKDAAGIVFITRGDGNNTDDPPVTEDMLEGKAIFTIPKIGWFNIAVRSALQWLR